LWAVMIGLWTIVEWLQNRPEEVNKNREPVGSIKHYLY
jgi:hypothetical protein